jgi:hypothetical protein
MPDNYLMTAILKLRTFEAASRCARPKNTFEWQFTGYRDKKYYLPQQSHYSTSVKRRPSDLETRVRIRSSTFIFNWRHLKFLRFGLMSIGHNGVGSIMPDGHIGKSIESMESPSDIKEIISYKSMYWPFQQWLIFCFILPASTKAAILRPQQKLWHVLFSIQK